MEFNNVEAFVPVPEREGLLMQRIPRDVEARVRPGTAEKCRSPANVEIRFVPSAFPVHLSFVCYESDVSCAVYAGDYQIEEYRFSPGTITLEIQKPERMENLELLPEKKRFSPWVIRILFFSKFSKLHFLSAKGEMRPPLKNELPACRYLTYGTSITQGYNACSPALTYGAQAAWRMGWDYINLGVGGQAFCEEAMAYHIAQRDDWDVFSACISVNMLMQNVDEQEFRNTIRTFWKVIAERNPEKHLYAISIFPYFADRGIIGECTLSSTPGEYRKALQEVCGEFDCIHYIDGQELMSFSNLSSDLIHPGTLGMIEIGEKLSKIFENTLG